MQHQFFFCPRCSYIFALPDQIEEEKKAEIARLVRARKYMEAITTLIKLVPHPDNLNLTDAKAIVTHIPHNENTCTSCGNELDEAGYTHCPHCKALNFNW